MPQFQPQGPDLQLGEMKAAKVSTDVVTFSSALDACATGSGQWEPVLKILRDMQAANVCHYVAPFR